MMRRLCFCILALLLPFTLFAEDEEFGKYKDAYLGPAVNCDPEHIAATHRELLNNSVSEDPLDANVVPEPAITLLTTLKHQLRELIGVTVYNQSANVAADELRQKVTEALQRSDITVGADSSESDLVLYGTVEDVSVKIPDGHSNLLAVQVDYAVACGSDSTLYVFEHTGTQWRMKIALEQNDYEDISGALGYFNYAISPPDEQGNWYLLYATIGNWCTSNWHGIKYKIILPGEDAYSPKTVFTKADGAYLDSDNIYKLSANPGDFQVSYRGNHELDSGLLIRTHIHHYRMTGAHVQRVSPVAMSPNGFLDEWIHLPWSDAQQWTRNPTTNVRHIHDLLQKAEIGEIDFEQPCPKPNTWLVAFGDEDLTLYATIELLGDDYFLSRLSFRYPPGCPGKTYPEPEPDELP